MNHTARKPFTAMRLLKPALVAALLWPAVAGAQGAKGLEGTWDVTVTLRNCATNDPIRSFPRMITFAKGGTLSEWAAAGLEDAPVARGSGQGSWEYLGQSDFSYSLKFLRLTPYGGPDGSISEIRLLEVNQAGDQYSADGVAVITFANGTTSPQLCATEAGTRVF